MSALASGMKKVKNIFRGKPTKADRVGLRVESDKPWLDLRYLEESSSTIQRPHELEQEMEEPPAEGISEELLHRIQGSMLGMALGDALGAHVEFRPHDYLLVYPVVDLQGGGTWALSKGQFTDDTSMALCLANSLVTRGSFSPYDQLVRYKWWFRHGYMSSTGQCFDIGTATKDSLVVFEANQKRFAKKYSIPLDQIDYLSDAKLINKFPIYCSEIGVAGNGALMRLAPVPLFFAAYPELAVKYSGISGQITHGDRKAYDACRYYGALIVAALRGDSKKQLLDRKFYAKNLQWFGKERLCPEVLSIAEGSYQRPQGYTDGIRGKGYIVDALEAALWAFWADRGSFEEGVLKAVNLGDDTDTTAAIYGQLAGAFYGLRGLPDRWVRQIYAKEFILNLSSWIAYEGQKWKPSIENSSSVSQMSSQGKSTGLVANPPPYFLAPPQQPGKLPLYPLALRKTLSDPSGDESAAAKTRPSNYRLVDEHDPGLQASVPSLRSVSKDDLSYDPGASWATASGYAQLPSGPSRSDAPRSRGRQPVPSQSPARPRGRSYFALQLNPRAQADPKTGSTQSTLL